LAALTVPWSASELDPAWFTIALERHFPGAVVACCRAGPVTTGTNRRAAVALRYAHGRGPQSVFVKLPGPAVHRLALAALGAVASEARLAESGFSFPLESPRLYAGAVDRHRLGAAVVMEDITAGGGRPHRATAALTPDQARSGLAGLARLHAAYWRRPMPAALDYLRPWRLGRGWAPLSAASLTWGRHRLRRAGGRLPAGIGPRALERQFRASAALAATGPQTLLHGDPHVANTYTAAGGGTGFYDWQLVRTGHWSHDAGYFLVSALGVDDRRRHERELLAGYLAALGEGGADRPTEDEAWERYRATPAFGLATWLHTLSGGRFQPADACLATIERFAAAYQDLDTGRSLVTVARS
jgi:hypothetical protein